MSLVKWMLAVSDTRGAGVKGDPVRTVWQLHDPQTLEVEFVYDAWDIENMREGYRECADLNKRIAEGDVPRQGAC